MSAKQGRTRKTTETATSPTFSTTHGAGTGLISTDDEALIMEALRIASAHIRKEACACAVIMPDSPMVDRLNVFAEHMSDLHARMM